MRVYDKIDNLRDIEKGWAITIGNFDGVHLGHQEIIEKARSVGKSLSAKGVAVVTFDPHPATILRPEHGPGILTPMEMRIHLLEKFGVDCLIIMKDSFEILNLSPKEFVEDFLLKYFGPKAIVEGPNFSFGYGRSGDISVLKELGSNYGIEVIDVPAMRLESWAGKAIMYSSTLIRNSLSRGDVVTAQKVMGRPYRLVGQAVKGRGIGKKLGYPTINIGHTDQVIPAEGVYAGMVYVGDSFAEACTAEKVMGAAFSIGRAKTFVKDNPLLVEAHVIEKDVGQVYGKWVAMDFIRVMRTQRRFENHEALSKQIKRDVDQVKGILAKET